MAETEKARKSGKMDRQSYHRIRKVKSPARPGTLKPSIIEEAVKEVMEKRSLQQNQCQ